MVMFLYRDEYYNSESDDKGIAEVIVGKHRNGPTGKVQLAWMEQYTKFALWHAGCGPLSALVGPIPGVPTARRSAPSPTGLLVVDSAPRESGDRPMGMTCKGGPPKACSLTATLSGPHRVVAAVDVDEFACGSRPPV